MIQTPGGSLKTYLQPSEFWHIHAKHLAGQWLLNSYIYLYFTVTRHLFTSFPVFTVITAVPVPLAVTLPLELTTATFLFEVV